MNTIIIYGTKYGTSKRYADSLAQKFNLEAFPFKKVKKINEYDNIIYIGSIYASGVIGMKKTLNKIKNPKNKNITLITVGVTDPKDTDTKDRMEEHIKNQLKKEVFENIKIFGLRGAIDYTKLNFFHKGLLSMLYKKAIAIPESERPSEIRAIIETYDTQSDFVNFNELDKIIDEIGFNTLC